MNLNKTVTDAIKAVENAYYDRQDYPPFKLNTFEDRAIYHAYIIKILKELETKS